MIMRETGWCGTFWMNSVQGKVSTEKLELREAQRPVYETALDSFRSELETTSSDRHQDTAGNREGWHAG